MNKKIFIFHYLPFLLVVSVLWHCTPPAEQQDEKAMTILSDTITRTKGNCEANDCIEVLITYPKFAGTPSASQIYLQLKTLIFNDLVIDSAKVEQLNMNQLADLLVQDYVSAKAEFKESTMNFEYVINGEVAYQHPQLWSIYLNIYTYTGGAHPMSYQKFLNVDPDTGNKIDLINYFDNKDELKRKVEETIRQTHDLTGEQQWSDVFFSDRFQWPENMGLTSKGLMMVYNPYEILPYAAGFTEIVIPINEAEKYLSFDLQTNAEKALQ